MVNQEAGRAAQRTMVTTVRKNKRETIVVEDTLPPLVQGEIRLRIDKVGLTANNMFYALMGEAPFLKFFSVYPVPRHDHLANVPAWGVATIIESANSEFRVGEQYRGFLHMANVVQMKARPSADGFTAYANGREKLNKAYNQFVRVEHTATSPFHGTSDKADLAMVAAPGALSGFLLCELLRLNAFYGGNSVVLTSASSKLSLAMAFLLREERSSGTLRCIIGLSSAKNIDFVRSTGLFDEVWLHEAERALEPELRPVLIDVAGDAAIYQRLKSQLAKAFAVGGTHTKAKSSTFSAFGPSALLKLVSSMVAPPAVAKWLEQSVNPPLEMFFAPTVMSQLRERWGREKLAAKSDEALGAFVSAALERGFIRIVRAEKLDAIQSQYRRIVEGKVPPSEAIVLSLADAATTSAKVGATALRA
jgi:hypothetical protein